MSSAIHATSGAAAGVVAMTLTYPLIFLSTRAAVQVRQEQKSTYQAVMDIINEEGITGLYSGLSSSLLGIAATNGFYYYFYESSRGAILARKVKGSSEALTTLESMLAGTIAGTATSILSNPIWVVQTTQAVQTMQAQNAPSTSGGPKPVVKKLSILETIRFILKKGGIGAFWRGIGPALVLVMNPIIQYTVFEQLKNALIARRTLKLRESTGSKKIIAVLTDLDFFILGALSKLVATSSTYPYIVLKSRLQAGHDGAQYKSSFDGIATIVKEEGVLGLYKGVSSKLTQSVLTAAILFAGQKRIFEIINAAVTGAAATTVKSH